MSLLPIYERPPLQAALEAAREGKMTDYETVERPHKMGAKLSVGVRRQTMRDERGEVTGILEIGRATRQKTQDTPSETQLRLLVEQMPVLLWTTFRACGSHRIGVPVCNTLMYMRGTWWGTRCLST
jgi:hypothetical protein